MGDRLRTVAFLAALTLTVVVYDARQSSRDTSQDRRIDRLEQTDMEQTSLLLCAVAVDQRMAVLLDGLIDEATQLEVDGPPDGEACKVKP